MSAAIVIDLISDDDEPVTAPKRKAAAPADDDYDSDCFIVEEDPAHAHKKSGAAGASTDRLSMMNEEMGEEEDEDEEILDEDDECEECQRPVEERRIDTTAGDEGDDGDVVFAGRTGDLALSDFPHARENCASASFKPGNERAHCPNCYCARFRCHAPHTRSRPTH